MFYFNVMMMFKERGYDNSKNRAYYMWVVSIMAWRSPI